MYFKKCILSLLSFACFQVTIIHTAHDVALPDQSMSIEDTAATKIQALVRRRQAQKKTMELQDEKNIDTKTDQIIARDQEEDAAATKIQAQVRRRLAQKKLEQMKKEDAAAKTLQKVGRGLFKRQQLSFDKILAKVPYDQFRDLICSGDFLDKTDWFYRYMEIKEGRQIFKRNQTDENGNKIIDVDNPELLADNPKNDFDKLFLKHMDPYLVKSLEIFADRAVHEITVNKMPWSQAVSIMQDGQPRYPLGNPYEIVLSYIFARVYEKIMPPFPMVIEKQYDPEFSKLRGFSRHQLNPDDDIFQGITFKAMGMEYEAPVRSGQTVQQIIEQNKDEALMICFQKYFISLGLPKYEDLKLDLEKPTLPKPEDYLDPATQKTDYQKLNIAYSKYSDDLSDFKTHTEQKRKENIDWTLVAHQVFELGRFLFENKLDAYDKLGGFGWAIHQPPSIQSIILQQELKLRNFSPYKPTPAKQIKFLRSGYNPNAKQPVYA